MRLALVGVLLLGALVLAQEHKVCTGPEDCHCGKADMCECNGSGNCFCEQAGYVLPLLSSLQHS